jgi:hypothetical protein
MPHALFIMVLFYCTAPDSCGKERPDGARVYDSRSACNAAIGERGRDYMAPHFLKDDSGLMLTCADKSKPISAAQLSKVELSE